MSRAAWAAIIAAIAFPTVALAVVLFVGPRHPPPPAFGAPAPGAGAKAPPPPPNVAEALVGLRGELELTDEQVERIWKIGEPARRRMTTLHADIARKEAELHDVLTAREVDEADVERCMEELHDLRLDLDKLAVLTPLRLREVLSEEQQQKAVEHFREHQGPPGPPEPAAGPHKGPPPLGHPPGKGPAGHPPHKGPGWGPGHPPPHGPSVHGTWPHAGPRPADAATAEDASE